MAEGPIRRACNRCHTQKLSCKRVGNESCERCLRLKAECKSSPSLRFRKSSNGNNNGSKSSSFRQASTTQQEGQSQKQYSPTTERFTGYEVSGMAYPGPYSFDGMTEYLWPGHNIDSGLLIYHSDGNPIYQAPSPSRTASIDENLLVPKGLSTSFGGEHPGSNHTLVGASTSMNTLSNGDLYQQWPDSNLSDGSCHAGIIGSNGSIWHRRLEEEPYATTTPETTFKSRNGNVSNNITKSGAGQTLTAQAAKIESSRGQYGGTRSGRPRTVSRSLVSDLCEMSTHLWDMSNSVPIVSTSNSVHTTEDCVSSVVTSMSFNGDVLPARDQQFSTSMHDRPFPMDSLFAVSRKFIETIQRACRHIPGEISLHDRDDAVQTGCMTAPGCVLLTTSNKPCTGTSMDICNDGVDTESFVLLADSTYAALLDVYQRAFRLVDVTAVIEQTLPQPCGENGFYMTAGRDPVPSSWKDAAAQACLKICRFPDISVGGFPVASAPSLQLGLGLHLADDFLVQFSHAIAMMHSVFPMAIVDSMEQQQLPVVTSGNLSHPPLVLSSGITTKEGVRSIGWNTTTAPLQSGLDLSKCSSTDEIVGRELNLRRELASLRHKLSAL